MKRVFLALLVVSTMAFSEGLMFRQGVNVINAGLNLNYGGDLDGVRPGVLIAYDRGAINNMFSLGGELGYYNRSEKDNYGWKYSYNYISPLFRFGFHPFGIPALDGQVKAAAVIDPYVTLAAGITFSAWSWEKEGVKYDDSDTGFTFAIKPGIRWFINQRVNLWAEGWWEGLTIGAGISF